MTAPGPDERRLSFGETAARYAASRPGYPAEAVSWVLAAATGEVRSVGDVGAGTGALTRVVAGLGLEVTAYEPDVAMLARLTHDLPGVTGTVADAEHLPAPGGRHDAMVAGQAWHWFDHAAASVELGRVTRAGGVLGLLWNLRDLTPGWARELATLIGGEDSTQTPAREGAADWIGVTAPWGEVERAEFPHSTTMTVEGLLALVSTYSYVRLRPDADDVLAEVRRIATEHPETRGRASFELPYVTVAYRSRRTG